MILQSEALACLPDFSPSALHVREPMVSEHLASPPSLSPALPGYLTLSWRPPAWLLATLCGWDCMISSLAPVWSRITPVSVGVIGSLL